MSTIKSAIKATEDAGTSISKDKLLDAIKKSADKPRFSIRTESGRINGCEFCWQIE